MPAKIILNPKADLGHGADFFEIIRNEIQSLGSADVVLSERPRHAIALTEEAIDDGFDVLIAAGGDGTINEVVNGIMSSQKEGIRLGIIPIGTGNDFAHSMGIINDVPSAVRNIFKGRTRWVDVGLMEDDKGRRRYFVNNMGVGLDANVIIRTQEITRLRGFPKYLAAVLTALVKDYQPLHLHVRYDEEEIEQKVLFLYLGVGTRGGGGFLLTPDALHDDDLIDSCTVPMLGRLRVASLINAATKGTHVHTPYPQMRQNREIIINSLEAMPIQIEGELFAVPEDDIHQIIVTSLPAALEVIV
jgi:YegS/Rv2252/BmrU family lipid kinase